MKLEELNIYNLSLELAEEVWNNILNWEKFSRETIGKHLIYAVDSVAANLSEGYGTFRFDETNHFNYYARGSLYETKTWLTKAHNRKLIDDDSFSKLENEINNLISRLNNYLTAIRKQKRTKTE
jgi:four helix bundle protein